MNYRLNIFGFLLFSLSGFLQASDAGIDLHSGGSQSAESPVTIAHAVLDERDGSLFLHNVQQAEYICALEQRLAEQDELIERQNRSIQDLLAMHSDLSAQVVRLMNGQSASLAIVAAYEARLANMSQ